MDDPESSCELALLSRRKFGGSLLLASATTVAAKLIGMQGRLGIVAAGAMADLIVVE